MPSKNLVLAIDQGTTGTTVLLVDKSLKILASKNTEYRQIYPKPGCVEHDLNDIWNSTQTCIAAVLRAKPGAAKKIAAIGITNQRETSCFWSKKTGKPLYNALVWQDRRTSEVCKKLLDAGKEPWISAKTGLVIDPYFSATKVQWALKNVPAVQAAVAKNDCAFGTIDSFLVSRLTGGKEHVTEPSNASRTLLYNIHELKWDAELLALFEVPQSILPQVLNSTDCFGTTYKVKGLPDGIPIHGILGDQQAALLGQACISPGQAKCTYGTGSFILMNTGSQVVSSSHRLLSTVAWKIGNEVCYALEGGAFTAGAAVQWVRDGLQFFKKSSDIEALAKKVKSSDGVVFVPGFTGVGAPYWWPEARATLFGVTRGTTQAHIARAVLEGMAAMNFDILRAMEKDLGKKLVSLNVDGGAAKNNLLMQFQSDLLERELRRPKMIETTALGAVFAAGLGVGLWQNLSDIQRSWKFEKSFTPKMPASKREQFLKEWQRAMRALKAWC